VKTLLIGLLGSVVMAHALDTTHSMIIGLLIIAAYFGGMIKLCQYDMKNGRDWE